MARDLHQTSDAGDRDDDAPEPPQIRRFRRLVSLSMVVMMIGMLGIMGALVWKLTLAASDPVLPPIASEIVIPEKFKAISVARAGSRLYLILENTETGVRLMQERHARDHRLIGEFRLIATPE